MNEIEQALDKLFQKYRIVFWYDEKKELREDFESINLDAVKKLEILNNEFNIKHLILRESPKQNFLIYNHGPKPSNLDNWLLDVLLANTEFRTDQAAIWLIELGLPIEFTDLANTHRYFFKSAARRKVLKSRLNKDDAENGILLKMLAACAECEARVDVILEILLDELAKGIDKKNQVIEKSGLSSFLWKQLERDYGYISTSPGIKDFSIELFKSCFAMEIDEQSALTQEALIFFKRWKDSVHHGKSFERLSQEYADSLGFTEKIQNQDILNFLNIDYFEIIDKELITYLIDRLVNRTITADECCSILHKRKHTRWYKKHWYLYKAIKYASRFLTKLTESDLTISSLANGVTKYTQNWHKLDLLYRKFTYYSIKSGETTLLESLKSLIENNYSNNYLLQVNNNWQQYIDSSDKWLISSIPAQQTFFNNWVKPFLDKKKKICVIISDAMRYEIGHELKNKISTQDRYNAKLETALSTLPSYTQLGMAALLPHKKLQLDQDMTAFADDLSTKGTDNRTKVIKKALSSNAKALTIDALMKSNSESCRELIKENSVVYIYQNRIDATGDKRDTEERVFEATEEAMEELVKVVKKLTAANASNILITADHGFLYQHNVIDDTDFTEVDVKGSQIFSEKRRFVIGKDLTENSRLKKFTAKQIGLEGDIEIQIPKSINRLRERGSGSRFVHGGASLQEVIIPVITVNKKRQSDVSKVDIDIIGSSTTVITSGQISVAFYQSQAISNKVQARELSAGIYTKDGKLISDRHDLIFDLTSERSRERELKVRFILTKEAEQFNRQEVLLKLKEKVSGTSHESDYKIVRYMLRRSFTSDF